MFQITNRRKLSMQSVFGEVDGCSIGLTWLPVRSVVFVLINKTIISVLQWIYSEDIWMEHCC